MKEFEREILEKQNRMQEVMIAGNPIAQSDVEILSLVDKKVGKCGNQGLIQTMDYNPCRFVMKDKKYTADIHMVGNAELKSNGKPLGITLQKGEYQRVSDNKVENLGFGDPIKDKKWIIYGLIAVAGYFAYKKFKK